MKLICNAFAYIWLSKGNQNEICKHPKFIVRRVTFDWLVTDFVLISVIKPEDVRITLKINFSGYEITS